MNENATILIPDISGFTEFLSLAALEHGSHIINELLEVIVHSNIIGLQIAEIEGDAVIFYKTGKPISKDELIEQCITIFENFHKHLKSIETYGICHCGACSTSVDLGLKFIVHYGKVRELSVANFRKPSGLEIIIAHRLLKNRIPDKEYILMSDQYVSAAENTEKISLEWVKSHDDYPIIGRLNYEYTLLEGIKKNIQAPTFPPDLPLRLGEKVISLNVNVPAEQVHENLVDPSAKFKYAEGLLKVKSSDLIPKIGAIHTCIFDDLTVDVKLISDISSINKITVIEQFFLPDSDNRIQAFYLIEKLGPQQSGLAVYFNKDLHPGIAQHLMPVFKKNVLNLKHYLESFSNTLFTEQTD